MSAAPDFRTLHELLAGDEDVRACRDIDEAACREQPRNFGVHVVSLSLTKMGDGIADAKLILSWLASALGAPAAAVAMLVPVREAFSLLPQLAVAAWIRRHEVRKWFWIWGCVGQAVALLAMAGVALGLQGASAGWSLVVLLALFSLARGVCSVAAKDVLGKTIAKQRRGRVSGYASVSGGVAVLALGSLLLLVPDAGRGPGLLAALLCVGAAMWLVAGLVFARLTEYPGATSGGANALSEAIASIALVFRDRQLALFLISRALLAASALMAPFLVLLASDLGHGGLDSLGLLVLAAGAADVTSASVWGRYADRSSRKVMAAGGAMAALAGLAAALLAVPGVGVGAWWSALALALLYFVLTVAHTGIRLGRKTHLVDMAGSGQRASYVAVSNTLIGIVLLAGGSFGVLAQLVGTAITVAVLGMFALAGALLSLGLREVQRDAG